MSRSPYSFKSSLLPVLGSAASVVLLPALVIIACVGRLRTKKFDIGLGPHPLINNVYHKRALSLYGYTAETFILKPYFITSDFDIDYGANLKRLPDVFSRFLAAILAFVGSTQRYRCLYIYFNGGPLSVIPGFLGSCEAFLFRLAGVKCVVMPFGGDVQLMELSPNLFFKHTMTRSYPNFFKQRDKVAHRIRYWTRNADHVLSGVEWVDYMYHWDTLMLGHFSIDTDEKAPSGKAETELFDGNRPLRVVHAPNHRELKGTQFVLSAIEELNAEGIPIALTLLEKRPNEEVIEAIRNCDVVIDQLVIGWYAMFALEAMSLAKPVICHVRADLIELYTQAGLLEPGESPFINADVLTIKSVLKNIALGQVDLAQKSRDGRNYVAKHHSLKTIGATFDRINREIGLADRWS